MLHVTSTQSVAHDLHMTAPGPLDSNCWRPLAVQREDCEKSQTGPLNVIITIIIECDYYYYYYYDYDYNNMGTVTLTDGVDDSVILL